MEFVSSKLPCFQVLIKHRGQKHITYACSYTDMVLSGVTFFFLSLYDSDRNSVSVVIRLQFLDNTWQFYVLVLQADTDDQRYFEVGSVRWEKYYFFTFFFTNLCIDNFINEGRKNRTNLRYDISK